MKKRISLGTFIAGALVMAGILLSAGVTVSAFTDKASLNVGRQGIGLNSPFDLVTVFPNGIVRQALPAQGVLLPVTGEQTFIPGRSVSVNLTVANNTPDLASSATVSVAPIGTGQVGSSPNITSFIRVTVFDTNTQQLLVGGSATNPALGVALNATGTIGRLNARGSAALAEGATWVADAAGSSRNLTIVLYYVDTPATSSFNGGQTALEVRFDATSTS